MKRPLDIAKEQQAMSTIVQLTSTFEGISSMRIAQTKDQVQEAEAFFDELWHIYSQVRVDAFFRFGRRLEDRSINKELFICITAEGGFSGDIDQKLMTWMLSQFDPKKQDIIVIGHHGAIQLTQLGIPYKKYYKLPEKDKNINVDPLISHVKQYKNTSVFYQTYVSLMVQDVKRIDLKVAVQRQATNKQVSEEVISDTNYIFEPSTYAVVAHLESSMLQITLSQLILDSKLAQYASRFRAMSLANTRVNESLGLLKLAYYRSKRALADERLKEIIVSVKKAGTGGVQ
jgi:ATP synthase F1 gamma subunit